MSDRSAKLLYKVIIDDLMGIIESGDFSYDVPICTEKSLCEKYNVSRITAKRAIDDLDQSGVMYRKRGVGSFVNSNYINSAELKYKQQVDNANTILALVVPFNLTRGGLLKAVETASTTLFQHNYCFTFHIFDPDEIKEQELLLKIYEMNIKGVVFYPSSNKLPLDQLNRFVADEKPVIILDKYHDFPHISNIVCDNFNGAYMLTEHLIAYGHEKICYLSRFALNELSTIRERYEGYAKCMLANKIDFEPRFVLVDMPKNMGYPMLKHVLNKLYKEGVTAIECENDEVAFNVYMCCRSLSIKVPEEMSITGFDNIHWATTGSAQITTVNQNFQAIGQKIAEVILQDKYVPAQHVIPVNLVPRISSGQCQQK